jgi:hypothetical protein
VRAEKIAMSLPKEAGTPGIVARSWGIVSMAVIGSKRISLGIAIYRSVAAKTRIHTITSISLRKNRS